MQKPGIENLVLFDRRQAGKVLQVQCIASKVSELIQQLLTPLPQVCSRVAAVVSGLCQPLTRGRPARFQQRQDLAAKEGRTPALFGCDAMARLGKIILSTSTLASDALDNGGFGPVNDDCYAIGYGIRSYGAEARVMTYGRDSAGFVDCLHKAMDDMVDAAKTPTP